MFCIFSKLLSVLKPVQKRDRLKGRHPRIHAQVEIGLEIGRKMAANAEENAVVTTRGRNVSDHIYLWPRVITTTS